MIVTKIIFLGILLLTSSTSVDFLCAKDFAKNQKYTKPSTVKSIVSKNGIKIFHMRDSSASLVHIRIVFKRSGAAYQKKSKFGVPEFYSSSVFCGSGQYTQSELEQKLSNISTSVTCVSDCNNLVFSITVPTIVLDESIPLLDTVISKPVFEKRKVKAIQNEIVAMLQNYAANPDAAAKNIFIPAMIFKSHVYEAGECGSSEDFAKLTIEDLKKYKEKYIVKKNAEAWVFGDISENRAIHLIDQILSGIAVGIDSQDTIKDVTPGVSNEIKKYYAKGPQSTVVFALRGVKPNSLDRYAAIVLFRIFGGRGLFKSRIMSVLRTRHGLIYGGLISMVDLDHANYAIGVLKTDNTKVEKAISCLRSIIKDLKENGITESELNFAKGNLNGNLLVGLRTSKNVCDFYFSQMLNGYGINALNDMLNGINNVTMSDVKKLSQEILDEENIPIVIIGDSE